MKFRIFTPTPQGEKLGGFWWQSCFHIFLSKHGFKFVTPKTSETFTTFSTARKEIYHLELALGATSRKKCPKMSETVANIRTFSLFGRCLCLATLSNACPLVTREWPRYCRKVKRPFWSKWPYSELDFNIQWTKMDQSGPFWPIGPFRSAKCTLAIPELQPKSQLSLEFQSEWSISNRRSRDSNRPFPRTGSL